MPVVVASGTRVGLTACVVNVLSVAKFTLDVGTRSGNPVEYTMPSTVTGFLVALAVSVVLLGHGVASTVPETLATHCKTSVSVRRGICELVALPIGTLVGLTFCVV
jgi:hypothetical protein